MLLKSRSDIFQLPAILLLVSLTFSATAAATAKAQSAITTRTLPKAEIEFAEAFTTISGVRELRDGRVIVSDSRDKTLQLIDLARGSATPIGRSGAGPAEWGTPGRLYAIPGDTTLMPDFSNDRFFVVNPDGKPGVLWRFPENNPLTSGDILGFDPNGRVFTIVDQRATNPALGTSGVAHVIRFDRRSGRIDTLSALAKIKGERSAATMMGAGMMRLVTNLPLAAQDLAVATRDGKVAIVRAAPYRVEWIAANGARTVGPVAASPNIRVTEAEKEAFTRAQIRPGGILVRGPAGGAAPPKGSSSAGGAEKISSAEIHAMMNPDMTWPSIKPPFLSGAAFAAPDGRVWVLRTRTHTDSIPTFDVFDGTGRVVERIALPKRTRLVGFGNGVIYLARTDDDDLVFLQRVRS